MDFRHFMTSSGIILLAAIVAMVSVSASGPVTDVLPEKPEKKPISVLFWNLENFFDWRDGGKNVSDRDFSSYGKKHWTFGRFEKKCNLVAKSILWMGEKAGKMPDVIGFAEIEDAAVVRRLVDGTSLSRSGYKLIHHDSADPRGIDVCLLYCDIRFKVLSEGTVRPSFRTRDILYAVLMDRSDGQIYSFLVNHHPSKFSGAASSDPKRIEVMELMSALADSLHVIYDAPVIAMGDFNDTPDGVSFDHLSPLLSNKGEKLFRKGEGTIRFQGRWDLIDLFFVTSGFPCRMKVIKLPFLMVPDKVYGGEHPFRTYAGMKYVGGVSDHCPIWLETGPM